MGGRQERNRMKRGEGRTRDGEDEEEEEDKEDQEEGEKRHKAKKNLSRGSEDKNTR
jgi:hypothetical protein